MVLGLKMDNNSDLIHSRTGGCRVQGPGTMDLF